MKVHSYESFGAADGPGVRFVVFLHGCGFRCRYCHNPDTWGSSAFTEVTTNEVLKRALRYRSYWGENGGITVSGGEPMLQAAEVADLFEKAHGRGITTCLDTAAGPFNREDANILRLLSVTDTVMLDIKHLDNGRHRELTESGNEAVMECARYLAEKGIKTWIRHVLVPGFTDDEDHLRRLGEFIRTLPNVERTEVLAYHEMGIEKWRRLGLEYTLGEVKPPDAEAVGSAKRLMGI